MKKEAITDQLFQSLSVKLAHHGYFVANSDSEQYLLKKQVANCTWQITYSFSGEGPYSVMATGMVIYEDITNIIVNLLKETEFSNLNTLVGVSKWLAKISGDLNKINIRDLRDADLFYSTMSSIIELTEEQFFIPYSDIELSVKEFMKPLPWKWPNSSVFQCAAIVVGYGILKKDRILIGRGINIAEKTLLRPNYSQREEKYVRALKEALIKYGYIECT